MNYKQKVMKSFNSNIYINEKKNYLASIGKTKVSVELRKKCMSYLPYFYFVYFKFHTFVSIK